MIDALRRNKSDPSMDPSVEDLDGERPPLPSYSQVTEGQQPPPLRFGGRVTDREQRHQRVPLAQGEDEEL